MLVPYYDGERVISGLIADLVRWAVGFVYSFGYVGVVVLIAMINLHLLPIPTQIVLSLAGFLVGEGRFSFGAALVASTVGAVVASLLLYTLGLWVGEENLYRLVRKVERFRLLTRSDLDRAGETLERYGGKAILIGHLFPGVGALISIPAGLKRMPLRWRFTGYTVLGCILWNGPFIALGWMVGAQWEAVGQYAKLLEYPALAAVVLGVLFILWRRCKARGQEKP